MLEENKLSQQEATANDDPGYDCGYQEACNSAKYQQQGPGLSAGPNEYLEEQKRVTALYEDRALVALDLDRANTVKFLFDSMHSFGEVVNGSDRRLIETLTTRAIIGKLSAMGLEPKDIENRTATVYLADKIANPVVDFGSYENLYQYPYQTEEGSTEDASNKQ